MQGNIEQEGMSLQLAKRIINIKDLIFGVLILCYNISKLKIILQRNKKSMTNLHLMMKG